jgi:tetratricopeptide (TPR) repeat protein
MVGTAPGAGLKKTASVPATGGTVAQDLQLLRELKSKNAEPRMIPVLERLADKYARARQYDKALYSLTASLALREKLLVGKGYDRALAQAALIKEQLGRSAEALEDMTRALALARTKRERTEKELEARSKKLAAALGLDPVKALAAFDNLWKARDGEKSNEETEALHAIGSLFEAADRPIEALKYLDRSSASMMADRARAYRKAGKTQEAERLEDQALQTFKELDYSRYTQMMRKAKEPSTGPRH